jgi:hypothetical protein
MEKTYVIKITEIAKGDITKSRWKKTGTKEDGTDQYGDVVTTEWESQSTDVFTRNTNVLPNLDAINKVITRCEKIAR